jgi:hypothetical protein
MNEQSFSHPVRGDAFELHYDDRASTVTLHKVGCGHPADSKSPFDPEDAQADDFFRVAPCARGTKKKSDTPISRVTSMRPDGTVYHHDPRPLPDPERGYTAEEYDDLVALRARQAL